MRVQIETVSIVVERSIDQCGSRDFTGRNWPAFKPELRGFEGSVIPSFPFASFFSSFG